MTESWNPPILSLAMTVQTLSQAQGEPEGDLVRTQIFLRREPNLRLKVAAAVSGKSMGEVLSDLIEAHLPPVAQQDAAAGG